MITEHDRHTELEVKQNIDALDPESILPWCYEINQNDNIARYMRFGEGLYLVVTLIEGLNESDIARERLTQIRHEIALERDMALMVHNIEQQARAKVRKQWTHTS